MKLLLFDRPTDKEIIGRREVEFFGPWAQPINSPEDLSSPAFEPYPDAYAVYNASAKAMRVANDIMDRLVKVLSDLTGVIKGRRFWDLYLGHHVILLANLVEDIKIRHMSLPEKDYILGLPGINYSKDRIPDSWSASLQLLAYDDYFRWYAMALYLKDHYRNHEFIDYSRVPMRRITGKCEELLEKVSRNYRIFSKKSGFMLFRRCMGIFNKKEESCDNACSLVWDRYQLEDFDFSKLAARILPEEYFTKPGLPYSCEADKEKREKIKAAFPFPYGELLSISLPWVALEGLRSLLDSINYDKNNIFRSIKRVYTHGQAFLNEGLKRALFALLADDGKKIITIQHGCAHTYLANSEMFLERMLVDENIYWGPGFSNYEDVLQLNESRAMSSIYLFNIKQKSLKKKRNRWDVLFVVLEENRYIKWLYSPLFPDLAFDYFKREKILFDYFCVGKNTAIKVYPETYGWKQYDWIQSNYPAAVILKTGMFVNYAMESKISIIDYNGTGFLEMLAMGRPFLATWNRRWFRGANRFEEFINKLIEIGVFYEDPEILIRSYTETISSDVTTWWNEKKRQAVLKETANNFAMASDTVYEEWTKEFQME